VQVHDSVTHRDWLPEWIDAVGGACWVSAPDGRLVHANPEARRLLGCDARPAPGHACSAAVRGLDEQGRSSCRPGCRAQLLARAHRPVEPFVLRLGATPGTGAFHIVQVIPLTAPDGSGPWLVHCAANIDRLQRMQEYLRELAAHSAPAGLPRRRLTAREGEVLDLLAQGHDPQRIAARLFLSYATVRNHVEHILAKLGVHSIQEAVAWRLLQGGPEPDAPPERRDAAGEA